MVEKICINTVTDLIEDDVLAGGVHLFDSIDSTNDWALGEIASNRVLPFLCMAEHQRGGRGRRGKHWLSPAGANIYMSLAWQFDLPAGEIGVLPLAQGVAIIRALEAVGIDKAWLKWPNDVLVDDRKIAGVLVETRNFHGSCKLVIGIGLNYCMPEESSPGAQFRWTDVTRSIDGAPPRGELAAILLREVVAMCRRYQKQSTGILDDIREEAEILNGRRVHLRLGSGEECAGTVLGVAPTGELRVLVDGQERIFSSAEVSLSGLEAGAAC